MPTPCVPLIAALVLVALAACATSSGVLDVTIEGGDQKLVIGEQRTLTASVAIGVTTITATSAADPTESDSIALAVDPPGALAWTRQFGTSGLDRANGIATDADGAVHVAGSTTGSLDGPDAGFDDVFVRSYDADGNLRWARQFGTGSIDRAYGITSGAHGSLHVAGYTEGALAGSDAGDGDAFVRSYDTDGKTRWTRQFGTSGDDTASAIASDVHGAAIVAGETHGTLESASAGVSDAFVRAYGGAAVMRTVRTACDTRRSVRRGERNPRFSWRRRGRGRRGGGGRCPSSPAGHRAKLCPKARPSPLLVRQRRGNTEGRIHAGDLDSALRRVEGFRVHDRSSVGLASAEQLLEPRRVGRVRTLTTTGDVAEPRQEGVRQLVGHGRFLADEVEGCPVPSRALEGTTGVAVELHVEPVGLEILDRSDAVAPGHPVRAPAAVQAQPLVPPSVQLAQQPQHADRLADRGGA